MFRIRHKNDARTGQFLCFFLLVVFHEGRDDSWRLREAAAEWMEGQKLRNPPAFGICYIVIMETTHMTTHMATYTLKLTPWSHLTFSREENAANLRRRTLPAPSDHRGAGSKLLACA